MPATSGWAAAPSGTFKTFAKISTLTSTVQTQTPKSVLVRQDKFSYPLAFTTRRRTNADGTATQTVSVEQGVRTWRQTSRNGHVVSFQRVSDLVHPVSARVFDVSGKPVKRTQHSTQNLYRGPAPHGFVYADADRRKRGADKSD